MDEMNAPNAILTRRGIEIKIDDITQDMIKTIKSKFIIRYKNEISNYYEQIKLFVKLKDVILFPRFAKSLLVKHNIISDVKNTIPNFKKIEMNYIGKSNDNQLLVVNHIMKYYYNDIRAENGDAGLTLEAEPGSGKTYLAMDLIGRLKQRTIIIVPNTYLLKQWEKLLIKYFPKSRVGVYYGKEKRIGDITVYIINSLLTADKKNYKDVGFVIFDESHMYCTEKFKAAYNKIQSTYMLGLSATPSNKKHNIDFISHYNIGLLLSASSINDYVNSNDNYESAVSLIYYNGPPDHTQIRVNEGNGMISIPKMLADLVTDDYRNVLIINELRALAEQKLNIFVFSDRRSHLEELYEVYNRIIKDDIATVEIPELNIILYGSSSDETIKEAKKRSKIIFTTYAYSSTGVSITRMSAIILATPRKSNSKQIIGRIFRYADGVKRRIIDIVDNRSIFKYQLNGRMPTYYELNSEIEKKNIDFDQQ